MSTTSNQFHDGNGFLMIDIWGLRIDIWDYIVAIGAEAHI